MLRLHLRLRAIRVYRTRASAVPWHVFLPWTPCLRHTLGARTQSLAQHACEGAPPERRACCGRRGGRLLALGVFGHGWAHERAAEADDLVEDVGVPEVIGETIGSKDQYIILLNGDREYPGIMWFRGRRSVASRGVSYTLSKGFSMSVKSILGTQE